MSDHIEELAELYALGSLDDSERARVEQHVENCEDCALRLDEASIIVADVAQAQTQMPAPPRLQSRLSRSVGLAAAPHRLHMPHWQVIGAIAAAFALAFIPAWVAVDRTTLARNDDNRALARLAAGPFNRATFMAPNHRPMSAKVLYGPAGDWYYVVVMHPQADMHVAYVHDGHMDMLGSVSMHGDSGTLYLPVKHKMEDLALLEGSTVVADARLVY
ncbi:MAG TPA: zf-HC2 domain-containing protein [Candidatus Baltobacteraceae bacterium]|jgi:hypothetical protein|nr:zf-HC2 domain-containing protein [Candidatus Baltobacteraceae bacterium]